MKTLIHLSMSVLLLIGTQLFLGCEKKPIIVPPVVLQPTVELTISPTGTLKYGDNCTISWTSTNANGGVLLNNQSVGISGTITKKLFRDTTFILRGVNGSLTATSQKDVKVGDWTTSKLGLITHAPWRMTANKRYRDGVLLVSFVLSEIEKNDEYFFLLDNKYKVFRVGVQIGLDEWSFSEGETKLYIGKNPPEIFSIDLLNEKKLVISMTQLFVDGLPSVGELTFERN